MTFDADTQQAVVEALSGLRAPFGVYGCLGNHDAWAGVEDSITELFRQAGVRILRGASVPIATHGESFNLIGIDFQSPRRFGPSAAVTRLLGNIEGLIDRDRVNILLSHNPDTFDRAAELGIDLSLAGHTHGGQAALEFISPEIAPSRLVTPYVAGWFRKPGGQLYVESRHRDHLHSDPRGRAAGDYGLPPLARLTRGNSVPVRLLPLLHQLRDHFAPDFRQPLFPALVHVAQRVLVQAQLIQHRGVDVAQVVRFSTVACSPISSVAPITWPPLMPPPAIHIEKPRL